MFHCGDLKLRKNNNLFPRPWERDRVRGLTEREKLEILRSSSTDLLQFSGLSLRMTDAFDKSNTFRHPEQSEGSSIADCSTPHPSLLPKEKENTCGHAEHVSASLAERTGQFPSPREEGVGERVQLEEKINSSLKIVSFRKMLKDNFSQPYGTQSHKVQLRFTCSASVSLGESSGCPVKHLGYLKNCAFTLAEVLITLGIIGVVAAITLPNLMTAYKARTLRSQFMKSYSLVQQAYKMMQADEESTSPDDYNRTFKDTYKRYFTGITNCTYSTNSPCLNRAISPYKTLDGTIKVNTNWIDDGQFALKDGTLLMFENPSFSTNTIRIWIFVDINGISRRPNRLGYDLFTFQLTDEVLKAMGDEGTDFVGDNYCSFSTNGYLNGITCANKAKNDPDYFKKVVKAIK